MSLGCLPTVLSGTGLASIRLEREYLAREAVVIFRLVPCVPAIDVFAPELESSPGKEFAVPSTGGNNMGSIFNDDRKGDGGDARVKNSSIEGIWRPDSSSSSEITIA